MSTIEYNYSHVCLRNPTSYALYGSVLLSTSIGVVHRFLAQLMHVPEDGFEPTTNGLQIVLRRWLRYFTEGIHRVEGQEEFKFL